MAAGMQDKLQDVREVVTWISLLLPLLPLGVGLWQFRNEKTWLRLLLLFLAITLLFDLAGYYVGIILKEPNARIYNAFPPVEFLLLGLMFFTWHDGKTEKRIIGILIPVFLLFWIITQAISTPHNLDNVILTVESVLLVIIAVGTLFRSMMRDTIPVQKNPIFWVSSALVVYFAGNLILFALAPTLQQDTIDSKWIWVLHSLLNVIKNLLFLGGFLACRTRISSSSAGLSSY